MSATTQADWLRRDLASQQGRTARAWPLIPITLGVFVACVGLVALRGQIQRLAYDLGGAVQTEQRLLQRERAAQAAVRELRDPRRLRDFAVAQGFVVPERVIEVSRAAVRP